MALIKINKFTTIDELQYFLAGGIFGSSAGVQPRPGGGPGIPNIVGKTLTFLAPAGTVTFVAGANPNGFLTLKEIKAQLEAAIPTLVLRPTFEGGRLGIIQATPTTGVTLKGDGTVATNANVFLGFDSSNDTVGKVYGSPYAGPAVVPYFIQSYSSNDNTHVVFTFE